MYDNPRDQSVPANWQGLVEVMIPPLRNMQKQGRLNAKVVQQEAQVVQNVGNRDWHLDGDQA